MLRRTHLALGIAVGFYFVPHIKTNGLVFLAIVLASSLIPDIESGFAAAKRHKLLSVQPTKWVFHKNRLLHTYTLLVPVTIIIAVLYPSASLPFFLGYSFHLILDSFSPQGIRPFWPLKSRSTGNLVPGGRIDKILFIVFLVFDIALFFNFLLY